MSGNNTDFEFGEAFSFDFELETRNNKKRATEPPRNDQTKRQRLFKVPKNVVKRKFPGPAGILPDRKDSSSILSETGEKDPEAIACSQMSVSVFHSSPWLDLTRDYEHLLEKYDINWIKLNAALNKLPNHRAPFLGAVVHNIECSEGKNALVKVVLKDVSGEIHGTVTPSLYEEYSSCLVAGAAIVLRECGVLTTRENGNHYLVIIPRNLVAVYHKGAQGTSVVKVQDLGKGAEVESTEHLLLVQDALEGIDPDSFLEDF